MKVPCEKKRNPIKLPKNKRKESGWNGGIIDKNVFTILIFFIYHNPHVLIIVVIIISIFLEVSEQQIKKIKEQMLGVFEELVIYYIYLL